jgi:hypothetical protein
MKDSFFMELVEYIVFMFVIGPIALVYIYADERKVANKFMDSYFDLFRSNRYG